MVSFNEIDGFFDDLNYALKVFKKDCKKAVGKEQFTKVCQKLNQRLMVKILHIKFFQAYKLYDSNSNDEGTITRDIMNHFYMVVWKNC